MDNIPTRQLFSAYLFLAALALFGWSCQRYFSVMMKGRKFPGRIRDIPKRIGDVILYFFMQRTVARESMSYHHLAIFWGFLIITLGSIELFIVAMLGPSFSFRALLGAGFDNVFKAAFDITNAVVLLVVIYAFFRRIVLKPRLIPFNFDAALILGFIALLCLTHFVADGFAHGANVGVDARVAFAHTGAPAPMAWMPVSKMFAAIGASMTPQRAHFWAELAFWVHFAILLIFLNVLPYSKHIHLLGALPNIALRTRDGSVKGVIPKMDLEDENDWGVGRYEQFHWKSLLDTYACTECARCSNNCPANLTDKPLSPMQLIHDIRYEMLERGAHLLRLSKNATPEALAEESDALTGGDLEVKPFLDAMPPLVGGRIHDETLWACTTCGACEQACPVFIEHPLKIIQMRAHLALTEGRVPAELSRMFRGMENNQNPWGIGSDKRDEWMEGRDVPLISDNQDVDYLVWVGCAGAYDDRAKKITHKWLDLLEHAGIKYAVLGSEEACTGDPARRAGNEFVFQMLAEANVETLNGYGVKKIVTSCPHCFHSLSKEYPQMGGNYEVLHHSQLLQQLVDSGKLRVDKRVNKVMTLHDPCYLGRWNNEYDAPRATLAAAGGREIVEMPRHGEKSFCCGAGGAHMWMEEEGPVEKRVNVDRTEEAIATGAKTIATACPFCNVMLTDGLKLNNKEEEIEVLDIAEVLASSISATAGKNA